MADPNAAARYLQRLGVRIPTPRRRPVVDGIDVEIGEAEMLPEPERPSVFSPEAYAAADAELAASTPEAREASRSAARQAELQASVDAQRARERESAARVRQRGDIEQRRRNIRAALPEALSESDSDVVGGIIDAVAGTPLAYFADQDVLNAMERGAIQGVTFGHSDELRGAARSGALSGPEYERERDIARAEQRESQERAPWVYGGAEVVGGMPAAMLMPGAGPGAGLAQRAVVGGLGGMALGGLAGSGHSEAPDVEGYERDVLTGAGMGGAMGVGSELAMAGGMRLYDRLRGAPAGTPRPGADFTPEQRARIDADPELRRMDIDRQTAERSAATRRVQSARPDMTEADLRAIDASYPGGRQGMARDMADADIAPRRSMRRTEDIQARGRAAERTPVVEIPEEPSMPEGVRPGMFPDDEHVVGPIRTVDDPGPARAGDRPRAIVADDIPPDPADIALGDRQTWEQQMRAEQARDPAAFDAALEADRVRRVRAGGYTGEEPESAIQARLGERARAEARAARARDEGAGTPRPSRNRRVADERLADPADVTMEPDTPRMATEGDGVTPYDELGIDPDEPIDFMMDLAPRSEPVAPRSEAGAERLRANIRAAERRERRGGYSVSTHDDRAWPVADDELTDITPPPLPRRADPADVTMEPPPLPERPLTPRRQVAPRDLGTWQPPAASPPPSTSAAQTPQQRVGAQVRAMADADIDARMTRPMGTPTEEAARAASDIILRSWGRGRFSGAAATASEMQSDALAAAIVRRLAETPETRAIAAQLQDSLRRGPGAFGMSLLAMSQRSPQVAQAVQVEWDNAQYVPMHRRDAQPTDTAPQVVPDVAGWDSAPYVPRHRRQAGATQ